MKVYLILSLATLAYSANLSHARTLADDFKDIRALLPEQELTNLISKYLTRDPEFQKIMLYFSSPDVYKVGELIGKQPEVREFYLWLQEQLRVGPSLYDFSDEDENAEKLNDLLNYKPNKSKRVGGWKGYMEELISIYPRDEIRGVIREKVAENGVFAEFWRRAMALKPVYERILKSKEMIKVAGRLRELGVDTKQLDALIREDFNWGGSLGQKKKLLGGL